MKKEYAEILTIEDKEWREQELDYFFEKIVRDIKQVYIHSSESLYRVTITLETPIFEGVAKALNTNVKTTNGKRWYMYEDLSIEEEIEYA